MILLMGPAGAGKSMQGHKLADEYGYAYISTGEVFRLLITGRRRAEMLEGKLLSDAETIHVLDKVLDIIDVKEQFILDGFPRTSAQVTWMLGEIAAGRFEKPIVVHLDISEEEIRQRLSKRGRPDDTDEAIDRRFKLYQEQTQPILEQMQQAGITVLHVDGVGSPVEIHENVVKALEI
ncbi:MAG: nucleoside monophosphate kinase [Candidatus Saccharimonadales bacterium]